MLPDSGNNMINPEWGVSVFNAMLSALVLLDDSSSASVLTDDVLTGSTKINALNAQAPAS